jgi:hypothetical protein
MLIPARIHGWKGIGRLGRRSVRPDPARTGSRLVRPAREYEPGPARYTAPPPTLTGLVVRAPGGAGRSWHPAFDPRTTTRHATSIVAAYVAGAAPVTGIARNSSVQRPPDRAPIADDPIGTRR